MLVCAISSKTAELVEVDRAEPLTLESRADCLEMVSRVTSRFAADSCINSNDCSRISTATSNSASEYWQPSPPNPSKQLHDARQVDVGVSARHSVAFNAAPDVEDTYSQIPLAAPPQPLGQRLDGGMQILSLEASSGSGQLL